MGRYRSNSKHDPTEQFLVKVREFSELFWTWSCKNVSNKR